jgi:hypothetical protein
MNVNVNVNRDTTTTGGEPPRYDLRRGEALAPWPELKAWAAGNPERQRLLSLLGGRASLLAGDVAPAEAFARCGQALQGGLMDGGRAHQLAAEELEEATRQFLGSRADWSLRVFTRFLAGVRENVRPGGGGAAAPANGKGAQAADTAAAVYDAMANAGAPGGAQ